MGHATRLRATDFVLRQLEHLIGKTNELSLPMTTQQLKKMKDTTSKLSSARALDMETTKWSKRKRGKQYHSKTTLLRLHQQEDFITFGVRNYAHQTRGTRICGYYAVASMIALCAGVDVSAHVFDENILVEELEENVKKACCVP